MIACVGSLELAQARLSARFGARPDAAAWQRIEPIRALPALVDATRQSPLSRWISGLSADADSHAIEDVLRQRWRHEVGEVAAWMPQPWQAAVRWWATWVDLPVLEHLARGQHLLPWMARDAVYRRLDGAAAQDAQRADDVDAACLSALRSLVAAPDALLPRWCEAWQARMPPQPSGAALLAELSGLLRRHLAALADPALRDAWPLRRGLAKRLTVLFRKAVLEPAAAFAYLALTALDLERLRAELVVRAIFTSQPATRGQP